MVLIPEQLERLHPDLLLYKQNSHFWPHADRKRYESDNKRQLGTILFIGYSPDSSKGELFIKNEKIAWKYNEKELAQNNFIYENDHPIIYMEKHIQYMNDFIKFKKDNWEKYSPNLVLIDSKDAL
jgi:hypothetical protein